MYICTVQYLNRILYVKKELNVPVCENCVSYLFKLPPPTLIDVFNYKMFKYWEHARWLPS